MDYEPPIIEDLKWKPTRVVNDKVYDGVISFRARAIQPSITIGVLASVFSNPGSWPKQVG